LGGGKRYCQAKIPIESDGFTVCDDLWGTKYEDGDQSTEDEQTICESCGRIDDLRYVANAKSVLIADDILSDAFHVLTSKRANKALKDRVIADLEAQLKNAFVLDDQFVREYSRCTAKSD
jgi:hypothetical protein